VTGPFRKLQTPPAVYSQLVSPFGQVFWPLSIETRRRHRGGVERPQWHFTFV